MWSEPADVVSELIDDTEPVRDAYTMDCWPLANKQARAGVAPIRPAAVAMPRSTADVARLLRWAGAHDVPVVPWGAGSSVTGSPLPAADSLVVDLRGLDSIFDLDRVSRRVHVGAGIMGGQLERLLAAEGLTTRFSPQSLHRSTVGGWVATRATGQLSSRWGGIECAVVGLTVVLADGEVVRVGTAPRGAVGPDLVGLFVGSEGALGVISEVTLRVHAAGGLSHLDAFLLADVERGLSALREIVGQGLRPALLRLYDADEARYLTVSHPAGRALLLCGFGGPERVAAAEHAVASDVLLATSGTRLGPAPTEAWLQSRYDFSRIESLLDEPGGYAETIEIAHGWRDIVPTYRAMKGALAPLADEVLGHFSHTYSDGISLYLIVTGRASDDREAVTRLKAIWETSMRTALRHGAVISHHHGVGQARAPYLADQLGPGLGLLRRVKAALDPCGTLHPGSLGLGGYRNGTPA